MSILQLEILHELVCQYCDIWLQELISTYIQNRHLNLCSPQLTTHSFNKVNCWALQKVNFNQQMSEVLK